METMSRVGAQAAMGLLIALAGLPVAATEAQAQDDGAAAADMPDAGRSPAAEWRAELEAEARGVWIASNAAYQEADGGIERFGLDWSVLPGGRAGRACLWGEREGAVTVFWRFSRLWDPIEERGIVHQSGPSGVVAIGTREVGSAELIQTLVQPNGARMELRHLTEFEGDSVRVDRSFQREPGSAEWTEGRTYRWVRSADGLSPC
jgi:hypothetical protein